MDKRIMIIAFILFILFCYSNNLFAYIGPGTGITAIAAFIAVIVIIIIAFIGFIWFPVKRLIKKIKDRKNDN